MITVHPTEGNHATHQNPARNDGGGFSWVGWRLPESSIGGTFALPRRRRNSGWEKDARDATECSNRICIALIDCSRDARGSRRKCTCRSGGATSGIVALPLLRVQRRRPKASRAATSRAPAVRDHPRAPPPCPRVRARILRCWCRWTRSLCHARLR
jgi:hypothetical protein